MSSKHPGNVQEERTGVGASCHVSRLQLLYTPTFAQAAPNGANVSWLGISKGGNSIISLICSAIRGISKGNNIRHQQGTQYPPPQKMCMYTAQPYFPLFLT